MKNQSFKGLILGLFASFLMLAAYGYSQATPYSSGQAVFVQPQFNSSLYTNYNYNPYRTAPQRLPAYTTNQAVFVQQPYATTQQTITSYPSTYYNSLPYTENRYTSPSAYPSTVAPAYPYANVGLYVSSPYTTTSQASTYRYPYSGTDYTTTYTYPYTTSSQTVQYPPPIIERVPMNAAYTTATPGVLYPAPGNIQQMTTAYPATTPQGYPSTTYNAYPVSTVVKYPYPTTTTAVPEVVVQPIKPVARTSGSSR